MFRKTRDHFLWQPKPFSYFQSWVDLLMMANHKDNKLLLGGEVIRAKRGEVITSQMKLAERWGWSRGAVRRFLGLLEDDQMVARKPAYNMTRITICNYDVYQSGRPTDGTADGTADGHNEYIKEELKNNGERAAPNFFISKETVSMVIKQFKAVYKVRRGLEYIIASGRQKYEQQGARSIYDALCRWYTGDGSLDKLDVGKQAEIMFDFFTELYMSQKRKQENTGQESWHLKKWSLDWIANNINELKKELNQWENTKPKVRQGKFDNRPGL